MELNSQKLWRKFGYNSKNLSANQRALYATHELHVSKQQQIGTERCLKHYAFSMLYLRLAVGRCGRKLWVSTIIIIIIVIITWSLTALWLLKTSTWFVVSCPSPWWCEIARYNEDDHVSSGFLQLLSGFLPSQCICRSSGEVLWWPVPQRAIQPGDITRQWRPRQLLIVVTCQCCLDALLSQSHEATASHTSHGTPQASKDQLPAPSMSQHCTLARIWPGHDRREP